MSGQTEASGQPVEPPFYKKIDLPLFLAGVITGILSLSNDAWWTLHGNGSNQIILFKVSPFYMETFATGLPLTTQAAIVLGAATRVLVGIAALLLIVTSVKRSVWWRSIAQWYNVSVLVEMFLSFTILLNIARQEALFYYGVNLPVSGALTLPFTVLGLDLAYYTNPTVTAGFSFVFYAGFMAVGLVSFERLKSLKMIEAFRQMQFGRISELTLAPPYAQVWAATDDKDLNPLSDDPDSVTDEKLVSSLTNMYDAVGPGGTVTILFPTWTSWVADKIRNLVSAVGFQADEREIVDKEGEAEVELKLLKPVETIQAAPTIVEATPMEASAITAVQPNVPQEPLTVLKRLPARRMFRKVGPHAPELEQQVWPRHKTSRKETAMVKSALKVISTYGVPVAYKELLNEVYLDLLQSHTEFESAREIEKALLSHVGHELVLVDEESSPGRLVRKWWSGDEPLAMSSAQLEAIERLRNVSQMAESTIRGLKERFHHKEGYRSRRKSSDEDSSNRT